MRRTAENVSLAAIEVGGVRFPMCVRRHCALSAGDNCCEHLDIALWCVEGSGCCWGRSRVQNDMSVLSAMCPVFILTGGLESGTSASSPVSSSSLSDVS